MAAWVRRISPGSSGGPANLAAAEAHEGERGIGAWTIGQPWRVRWTRAWPNWECDSAISPLARTCRRPSSASCNTTQPSVGAAPGPSKRCRSRWAGTLATCTPCSPGSYPPDPDAAVLLGPDAIAGRLAAIEGQLRSIEQRLIDVQSRIGQADPRMNGADVLLMPPRKRD